MILYKYMPFWLAEKVLANSALLFSHCERFNDPFDTPRYPDRTEEVRGNLARLVREKTWRDSTGLLCLTRTPTNPLMWAHYADSHKGVVLGIDVELAGFTDEKTNLIPAQFGSIVYVSHWPNWPYFTCREQDPPGAAFAFQASNFERMQRLFLTKPIHWAYEEEVRIAKCIRGLVAGGEEQNPSGRWVVTETGEEARHLFQIPRNAIREVHFGIRSDVDACDSLREAVSQSCPELKWLECTLGLDAFDVQPREHIPVANMLEL